jgi:hypothetical protein
MFGGSAAFAFAFAFDVFADEPAVPCAVRDAFSIHRLTWAARTFSESGTLLDGRGRRQTQHTSTSGSCDCDCCAGCGGGTGGTTCRCTEDCGEISAWFRVECC